MIYEFAAALGLALAGWGVWELSPPAAKIAVGTVILIAGIAGARSAARRRP